MSPNKIYLAGKFVSTNDVHEVLNPFDHSVIDSVYMAGTEEIEQAIQSAVEVSEQLSKLEPYQRADILQKISEGIQDRFEEFAQVLSKENGKTIKESRGEITRAISTFDVAVGEATRIYGESYDAGITKAAAGRRILVRKFPIGPVAAISPFNFPLNLSVHKIAPAIAAGCPVVLKPASKTPLSCLMLSEIIDQTDLPKGAFSCLPCTREAGQKMVEDERFKLLSFTGSPDVGWKMKKDAGKKKVVLELGGNAGLIIDEDVDDLDHVVNRASTGAFYQSGQVCISVQHIYCVGSIYEKFKEKFRQKTASLKVGNPLEETTDIGPVIDQKNQKRIKDWIDEAIEKGATVLEGNIVDGTAITPTILENVDPETKIYKEEAFGPVVNIHKVSSVKEAVDLVNNSTFGLQVGIFSKLFDSIQYVFDNCHVGGVIANDVPAFRVDHMPYGGIKDSGLGREGIKYAMEDMLEPKALVYFSS